jgi:hypothetical protein
MPNISKNAFEQTTDSPLDQVVTNLTSEILSTSSNPIFICGVNRKINIGNYENIDVYAGITLPLQGVSLEDRTALEAAIKDAATYAFSLMAQETGERYLLIKNSQQGN